MYKLWEGLEQAKKLRWAELSHRLYNGRETLDKSPAAVAEEL